MPEDFQSYKILHVSTYIIKDLQETIKIIRKGKFINPDIILVTGDLIDSRHTNLKIAIKGAIK